MKFKPSTKVLIDRRSKKYRVEHHYMHTTSTDVLLKEYDRAIPKMKQKIRNELVRRKVAV